MEDCWMAKKSNKTAHVLSLLTNGQGTLDDDVAIVEEKPSKSKVSKAPVVEEPQPITEEPHAEEVQSTEVSHIEIPQDMVQQVPTHVEPTIQTAEQPTNHQFVSQQQDTFMQPSVVQQQPQYQSQMQEAPVHEQHYQPQIQQAPMPEHQYQPQMQQVAYDAPTLHPQAVPIPSAPGFSKTTQMAQFANYESQIMTQNEISAIPSLIQAMPVQKPEVVVQMQSSDETVALADLVKADLEKALEKQIQERLEADAKQKNYDENDRPPYSATFLSKFGENLKQVQQAREAAKEDDILASEVKLALEQNLEQSMSESLVQESSNNSNSSTPSTEDIHVDPFASPMFTEPEEDQEPTYESVKKEAYVWENFDDDEEEEEADEVIVPETNIEQTAQPDAFINEDFLKSTPFEQEVLKSAEDFLNPHFSDSIDTKEETMGTEYTAINSPSIKDADDAKKIVIRNLAEELVKAKAPEIMSSMNMCTCPACVLDVVALTLNHTQPLYVSTEKGELFSKLAACDLQYGTDIASEITKACLKIKLNPRHPSVE